MWIDVVSGDAVEVEEGGVELGAEAAATVEHPSGMEGLSSRGPREGPRGPSVVNASSTTYGVAATRPGVAATPRVAAERQHGRTRHRQLLDDEVREVSATDVLAGDVVAGRSELSTAGQAAPNVGLGREAEPSRAVVRRRRAERRAMRDHWSGVVRRPRCRAMRRTSRLRWRDATLDVLATRPSTRRRRRSRDRHCSRSVSRVGWPVHSLTVVRPSRWSNWCDHLPFVEWRGRALAASASAANSPLSLVMSNIVMNEMPQGFPVRRRRTRRPGPARAGRSTFAKLGIARRAECRTGPGVRVEQGEVVRGQREVPFGFGQVLDRLGEEEQVGCRHPRSGAGQRSAGRTSFASRLPGKSPSRFSKS